MNNDQRIIEELSILRKEIDRLKRVEVPIMPIIPVVTEWQNWTPSSVVGWSSIHPASFYRYCVIGKVCYFAIRVLGTSNTDNIRITLPITSFFVHNDFYFNGAGHSQDNGVSLAIPSRWFIQSGSDLLGVNKDFGTALWTTSGTKQVYMEGFYEIP